MKIFKSKISNLFMHWAVILLVLNSFVSCDKKSDDIETDDDAIEDPVVVAVTAKAATLEMGPGFNLGNTFDNGLNSPTLANVRPIIDLYHNAGMKHVRIPVTWMDRFTANDRLADANGNIDVNNPRLLELVRVINYAISLKMYVVINTHHEHWLKDFYDGSAAFDTKFAKLWTGIGTYFKDYPHFLIFEVLNEPEGKMGQWGGGWPDPNNGLALSLTRRINQVGYDAIRATGGNNVTRVVMIAPNGQGNEAMVQAVYPSKASLPGGGKDSYLAIQVHSYNPWAFCGQTGSNSAFPGNATIENAIKKSGAHSKLLDVPFNYGEFGVGRTTGTERNTDIVRGYYRTFAKTALAEQMSYSVWDDRGWFGLVSGSGSSFIFTSNIVPTMLAP